MARSRQTNRCKNWLSQTAAIAVCFALAIAANTAHAQFNNGLFRQGVVGGVKIDAEGLARDATVAEQQELLKDIRGSIRGPASEFNKASDLRMISLKGLQKQIALAVSEKRPLDESVLVLGGLTAIEYVFAYPEKGDIVIAGPAEPWKVSERGSIVGTKSGKPVMYLDDLLCAFRTVEQARSEGISVSIEPTSEGVEKLNRLLANITVGRNTNFARLEEGMREAFGMQNVRLTGLPQSSHTAAVLLAADYQMKRLGMNLVKAPVKGLPSYIEMIRNSNSALPQSRWWMECDYNAIEKTEDSLAWHISGNGIKALSEESFVTAQGLVGGKRKNAKAERWAEVFTNKLDELMLVEPVFGELKNVMDLSILAALIESYQLDELAECDLSVLKGETSSIELAELNTPKSLPPQCSFIKSVNGWITTASGGVSLDSWGVVAKTEVNKELASIRDEAGAGQEQWCWN